MARGLNLSNGDPLELRSTTSPEHDDQPLKLRSTKSTEHGKTLAEEPTLPAEVTMADDSAQVYANALPAVTPPSANMGNTGDTGSTQEDCSQEWLL